MCGPKKTLSIFNRVCKRYGRLRRPRGSRGGLYREARNILFSGVNQGTLSMRANAVGQRQMSSEQNACDAAMASEAVDAGPAAVAASAGHADASAGNDAAPRWLEIHLVEVSPEDFVNEHGEQCDAYFRLLV